MSLELEQLVARARAWADDDCDATTAEECRLLASSGDLTELRDHFGGQLEFGTAGLRAKVGPGPWRMNRATVRRASRAVAEHLQAKCLATAPRVVVAYDARSSSRQLALETYGTLSAAGIEVLAFAEPTPTPIAAFAVLAESADAAIVITASHNPKQYNGYKLYGAEGTQIVGPVDVEIAARMAALGPAKDIAWQHFDGGAAAIDFSERITAAYFAALRSLHDGKPRRIRIAYSPLHGLGAPYVERALNEAGFPEVLVVKEQRDPHPEFPTVPFPNPEEQGVMDRVFALAEKSGAEVALATDPDVDRLAVGVLAAGTIRALDGNQVGVLLADYLLRKQRTVTGAAPPLVVQSVVSTPMVGEICAAHGARWERTLTGFKWIGRPAIALRDTWTFVLGFEEAIGYATLPSVRDKDGISAALVFAQLVNECALEQSTLPDRLLELYQRFGLWVSHQHNVHLPGAAGVETIDRAMTRLRDQPPSSVSGVSVSAVTDYASGEQLRPAWLPNSNLIELTLGDTGRLLVRPSGTEPKLKVYVDVRRQAPDRLGELASAELAGRAVAASLAAELVRHVGLDAREGLRS